MAITAPRRAPLAILGLLGLVVYWASGCSSLQSMLAGGAKPTAVLHDVSFKDVSLTKVGLQFEVDVTNPYEVPLPLANLDYNLTSGASRLLKGAAALQGAIPAKQTKTVSLPVDVSLIEVLNFARGLRPGAAIPYTADVKLGVDAPGVGRIPVPVGKSGQISIPSLPGL